MVLETAVNGQAELLITHNERDFVGAEAFGVTVLSPARFLERIKG
jgi:predicted nucleic acid-binding protein